MARKAKITPSGLITAIFALALVTLAIGMGIRQLRQEGVFSRSPAARAQKEPADERTASSGRNQRAGEQEAESQSWQEQQAETTTEQQPQETADETQWASDAATESANTPAPAAGFQPGGMGQGAGGMQGMWGDLNLTEAEQARLREGWALAMERWQNMSPEEQRIMGERMRAGWERWQNMSPQEQEEAGREMRNRFEDWRQSDSPELPDMMLD